MSELIRILNFYVLPIGIAFGVAGLLHAASLPIARNLIPIRGQGRRSPEQQAARRATVVNLVAGTISGGGFTVATFIALAQFISVDTLVWMIGLFGAGFGFSAKPFIGDYMTGVAFITEDSFDVGDKVEIMGMEGVVEAVTLRMTTLRGNSGEIFTVPNGEIRAVRNFSRGRFTPVKVSVRVNSSDLERAVPVLEELGQQAPSHLPTLLEPWQVLNEETRLGQHAELTLVARAAFGKGAQTRPRLLTYVRNGLSQHNIALVD